MSHELSERIIKLGVGRAHQIYPGVIGRFYSITDDWQDSMNSDKYPCDIQVVEAMTDLLEAQRGALKKIATANNGEDCAVLIAKQALQEQGL